MNYSTFLNVWQIPFGKPHEKEPRAGGNKKGINGIRQGKPYADSFPRSVRTAVIGQSRRFHSHGGIGTTNIHSVRWFATVSDEMFDKSLIASYLFNWGHTVQT